MDGQRATGDRKSSFEPKGSSELKYKKQKQNKNQMRTPCMSPVFVEIFTNDIHNMRYITVCYTFQ